MPRVTQASTLKSAHLTAALEYAGRGWAVFPCHEMVGTPNTDAWRCSCGAQGCARGKHPRTRRGVLDATSDMAVVRQWWTQWPTASIGIACGPSNLVVVDVDPRNGGTAPPGLPPTLTANTGGGGQHYLFTGSGKFKAHIGEGVDLKAAGGYIIAAPSIHASGTAYSWDPGQPDDPAPLPEWIASQAVPESTVVADPNAEVTQTRLFRAFQAAGLVKGLVGHGKVGVVCPWEHEHSEGPGAPSSASVLPMGGYSCLHGHCTQRTTADVWAWFEMTLPHCVPPEQEPDVGSIVGVPMPETATTATTLLPRLDQRGIPVPTAGNLALVLTHDTEWGQLKRDTLAGVTRWGADGPDVSGFVSPKAGDELADHHVTYISQWFLTRYGLATGREAMHEAAEMAAHQRAYDPLVEYLSSLQWDGVKRVHSWLHTYLGADQTPPNELMGSMWLISAAARGLDHGCQVDHVLVLEGFAGGEGKTRVLRILAGDYFGSLPSLKDYPRAASSIRGRWIVEIGELDAIRGNAASTTKDFLTQQWDRFRPSYARCEITSQRSCVFAGTTNEAQYLEDTTGNRRFWPVTVTRYDLEALTRDRDQLWAEAVHLYRSGAKWWPTTAEERESLRLVVRERQDEDPWTESVLRAASACERGTCDILMAAVGISADRITPKESRRTVGILQFHGYRQMRRRQADGSRGPRVWVKGVPNGKEST